MLFLAQGMDFTTDKLRSMVRKWQTLIEANVDVKTTDGYYLRLFCIAFTKKRKDQIKKTCYAQTSQIRKIRAKMVEIMMREAAACDLKELVGKFIPEAIGAPTSCAVMQITADSRLSFIMTRPSCSNNPCLIAFEMRTPSHLAMLSAVGALG